MKHEDDQWEKHIRKGPFAASPFTEDHKRNVQQQVEWIQTRKCEQKNSGTLKPVSGSKSLVHFKKYPNKVAVATKDRGEQRHKRLPQPKSRRGILAASMGVLVIAGGMFLWNWDDGQLAQPFIEQIHPASALLFSDHLNVDILTDKMKKNIAVTLRDDLGKQLRITKVQELPVSGRIYIEAGQEKDANYAHIWLDAKTGNLREVQMRAELQPSKLEHRYLRQVPSLLESIGSIPTLKPERVNRWVNMKQGEVVPTVYTVLELGDDISYGEITWKHDKALSVAGELRSDQIPQTALAHAKKAIEAFSGKPNLYLEHASRDKDDEIGEDSTFFSFNDNYFVKITETSNGRRFIVADANDYGQPQISSPEQMEAYQERLLNMDESLLRKEISPYLSVIFKVDLEDYKLHRNPEDLGTVTFKRDADQDVFQVRYKEDGRVTMVTREEPTSKQ
ncbi:hypothetical protein [Paenibacillus silvae]|uniref:Uncharacterized protein n=1 Tax=Paenibacillus silvae TaxID=1325358 RepID=A0A2W6N8N6_9BACL|nr:hypothetical protein [Paenibacillus silvae]PZT52305.1 hypothetical protein DN757_28070 [Paenibacillus silvae]